MAQPAAQADTITLLLAAGIALSGVVLSQIIQRWHGHAAHHRELVLVDRYGRALATHTAPVRAFGTTEKHKPPYGLSSADP